LPRQAVGLGLGEIGRSGASDFAGVEQRAGAEQRQDRTDCRAANRDAALAAADAVQPPNAHIGVPHCCDIFSAKLVAKAPNWQILLERS
jgi:hypothetical protein